MTRSQLLRAVSRATGEPLSTIRRFGFSAVHTRLVVTDEPDPADNECSLPQAIDWDELDQARLGMFPGRRQSLPAAA